MKDNSPTLMGVPVKFPMVDASITHGLGIGFERHGSYPFTFYVLWLFCVRVTIQTWSTRRGVLNGTPPAPVFATEPAPEVEELGPQSGEIRIFCEPFNIDYKVPYSVFEAAMPGPPSLPRVLQELTKHLPEKTLGSVEWEGGRVVVSLKAELTDSILDESEIGPPE